MNGSIHFKQYSLIENWLRPVSQRLELFQFKTFPHLAQILRDGSVVNERVAKCAHLFIVSGRSQSPKSAIAVQQRDTLNAV